MASGPSFYQPYLCNWCLSIAFQLGVPPLLSHLLGGVQDTLRLNIASWHIEYLKLQEFEKIADAEMLLCPSLLKQVIDPHIRGVLPTPGGKEHSSLRRVLNNQTLLNFPHALL